MKDAGISRIDLDGPEPDIMIEGRFHRDIAVVEDALGCDVLLGNLDHRVRLTKGPLRKRR